MRSGVGYEFLRRKVWKVVTTVLKCLPSREATTPSEYQGNGTPRRLLVGFSLNVFNQRIASPLCLKTGYYNFSRTPPTLRLEWAVTPHKSLTRQQSHQLLGHSISDKSHFHIPVNSDSTLGTKEENHPGHSLLICWNIWRQLGWAIWT